MSVKELITCELDKAASASPGPLPLVSVNVDGGRLQVELSAVGQLGCAFTSFSLESPLLAEAPIERLRQIAEDLSGRLSYLLEPISPIETDDESCVVQMRSNPPFQDDDGTHFYELIVERGSLRLCRYAKQPHRVREVVPAEVTREVLIRLAGDFEQVVQ